MFQRLLLVLVIQYGLAASALAEPSKPTGEALRQAVSGRTVLIETQIGSFPIRYKSDGTMTDPAPAFVASLGTEKDRGQWWVADDRLCQRWYRWLDAKQYCLSCNALGPPFIGCAMTACRYSNHPRACNEAAVEREMAAGLSW
jgi:hypothetical protein